MKLLNNKSFKDIFFSTTGRLGIIETWIYSLGLGIIEILILIGMYYLIRIIHGGYNDLYYYSMSQRISELSIKLIGIGIGILLIIMDIFVLIKRAHDLGKKGSRLRYLLIPIYNIFVFIQLSFFPGEKHDNEFGKYNSKKLPIIVYIVLIIEFTMILGYVIFGKQPNFPYRDRPYIEYIEWFDENEEIENLLLNDSYNEDAGKEFMNIVNSKLNCNCFGDNPTEKPTIKIDRKFWDEVYEEFENKLLELANNPKYSIEK